MSESKAANPSVMAFIHDLADEENKQTALDFIAFLKTNRITPGEKMKYKGKRLGSFGIANTHEWYLQIFTQYDDCFFDLIEKESEKTKAFVRSKIEGTACGRCIQGKCAGTFIRVQNPDRAFIALAKKLVLLRCEAILSDRVPKCNYIKLSNRGTREPCRKCKVCNPACRKSKNF